jgi:hypothetical protein
VTREGEDKVIYDFADRKVEIDNHSRADGRTAGQLVLDFYTQLTGQPDLAYQPAPKEEALAQDYLTTYGLERSVFIVHHALLAAKAVDFPIQTFGGTKNFLPQALAAWEGHEEAKQAKREADVRVDTQYRREHEEQEKRQRVAEIRARLPEDVLATLRHRAQEALATEGVARTHLGYEVLVKLKVDEFLEEEYWPVDMPHNGGPAEIAAT